MPRRVLSFVVVSGIASIAASVVATFLYFALVLREPLTLATAKGAVFIGGEIAVRGLALAVPAGALFAILRRRTQPAAFVAMVTLIWVILGALLGFWLFRSAFHVSWRAAAALLATTWGVAGLAVGLSARTVV